MFQTFPTFQGFSGGFGGKLWKLLKVFVCLDRGFLYFKPPILSVSHVIMSIVPIPVVGVGKERRTKFVHGDS